MPNAYYWWQGGREGGQESQKPAYVIHGCSLSNYKTRRRKLRVNFSGEVVQSSLIECPGEIATPSQVECSNKF